MKDRGITLISLVTIMIILLILSSVVITLQVRNNGILTKAKYAKEETNRQTATEKINLKIITAQMNNYAETQEMPTLKELSQVLKDDQEIQYVTEKSKVASAEYNVPSENPISIYTKLKQYSYEFEINSDLQLESIDGVKVATGIKEPRGKITLIYDTHVNEIGEYTLKESIENYDVLVVIGSTDYNSSIQTDFTIGHSWILTQAIKDKGAIRIGVDDSKDKCMAINFKGDKLIIIGSWNYSIQSIYGIKL